MRSLVYVVLIALAVAGPALYLTVGGSARKRAADATAAALAERGQVAALMNADAPPSAAALKEAEAALLQRRSTVDGLRAAIAAAKPAGGDASLRERALALGLDVPVVDSLLAGLDGTGAVSRRFALASALGSIEPDTTVERVHCGSLPEVIAGLDVQRWRIELTLVAPVGSIVRSTESLCAGADDRAPALLIGLEALRSRADEWAKLADVFAEPPLRAQVTVDVLVADGGAP